MIRARLLLLALPLASLGGCIHPHRLDVAARDAVSDIYSQLQERADPSRMRLTVAGVQHGDFEPPAYEYKLPRCAIHDELDPGIDIGHELLVAFSKRFHVMEPESIPSSNVRTGSKTNARAASALRPVSTTIPANAVVIGNYYPVDERTVRTLVRVVDVETREVLASVRMTSRTH